MWLLYLFRVAQIAQLRYIARQLLAIIASEDRTAALGHVHVPTLVLHGANDPLIDASGARATADAIADAELVVIDGMGHDLPRALWRSITERIANLVARAEASLGPAPD